MLALVKGLVSSARFWVFAGLATALLAFAKWGYDEIYQNGYNAAELKWREAQQAAIDEAVQEARDKWEVAAAAAEENIRVETEIVERVRVVEREVPRIVERIVPAECRDLGPDIKRLYNDAIRASGNIPRPDPNASAETPE